MWRARVFWNADGGAGGGAGSGGQGGQGGGAGGSGGGNGSNGTGAGGGDKVASLEAALAAERQARTAAEQKAAAAEKSLGELTPKVDELSKKVTAAEEKERRAKAVDAALAGLKDGKTVDRAAAAKLAEKLPITATFEQDLAELIAGVATVPLAKKDAVGGQPAAPGGGGDDKPLTSVQIAEMKRTNPEGLAQYMRSQQAKNPFMAGGLPAGQ